MLIQQVQDKYRGRFLCQTDMKSVPCIDLLII